MKSFIILFAVSLSIMCYAQQNNSGSFNPNEVKRIKSQHYKPTTQIYKPLDLSGTTRMVDTLNYPMPSPGANFGFFGQDWVLQWFRAPGDLVIKGLGFYCTNNPDNTPAEVKIVRLNWNESQLLAQIDKHQGYYPADGSIAGITSFLDNPDRTGGWVAIDTTETEPFAHDIWSDNGVGYSFIPNPTLNDYQWIDTDVLGYEPIISQGEVFGVAVKNTSTVLDSNRIGFFAGQSIGYPFWKFYANGRLIPGVDKGWWTRDFTFDFRVAVDIWPGGDVPIIDEFTVLNSTLSTEPRPINAIVRWGYGPQKSVHEFIVSAYYSINNGNSWEVTLLNHIQDSLYAGQIPGFPPNTRVDYFLEAKDSASIGWTYYTHTISYTVFGPSGANTLVVFNGYSTTEGYPQDYLFGPDIHDGTSTFAHDTWAYGPLTSELLNYYDNLIEICNGAPDNYNDSIVRPWLAANGNRNYYLEGQEWLGRRYGYVDTNFVAGDFEFDVLGINASFNDVSYNGTSGQLSLLNLFHNQVLYLDSH